jgi:phage shock protein PspC (stress-responsive transcriptional regulator)
MRYVEIMKCPKDEKVLLGIVGGLSHYVGVRPWKARFILSLLALMALITSIELFMILIFCYGCSFFVTPVYEEMYDKEVNPDAQPDDIF